MFLLGRKVKKGPKYKNYVYEYKICIKHFKYDVDLLWYAFYNGFSENCYKTCLNQIPWLPTNTVFPVKEFKPRMISTLTVRQKYHICKEYKRTISFTLQLHVHIIYSASETPTRSAIKNILCLIPSMDPTCNTQVSWPRTTFWMETPEENTLKFQQQQKFFPCFFSLTHFLPLLLFLPWVLILQ